MSDATPEEEFGGSNAGVFQTTHWSVVREAAELNPEASAAALERLCRTYWYPLYAYVRRLGHSAEESQDLTQEFFARLLSKHYLARANRSKGRFRSFLLSSLNHFLNSEWRRCQAVKRGAGRTLISLDETAAEDRYTAEAVSPLSPERLYERRWALELLDLALARLRAEYAAAGRGSQFEQLQGFLTTAADERRYAEVAPELGISPGAAMVAVHRLRQRYRDVLREEIAQTVNSPSEIDEEIRWLFAAIG